MKNIRSLLSAAALALPFVAFAASHDLATFVADFDLNKDGSVSKEEFQEAREKRFAATDTNHDAGLSREEYVAEFRTRLMAANPDADKVERQIKQTDVRFNALDTNKDGRISFAEYSFSGWRMFGEHDYDRDGAVSLADKTDTKSEEKRVAQDKTT